ncbi:MAG: iron ABC transporter permease [Methanosarcinales archaeon]|nr:iron ABC transporter permease [Methanosarcinales archaeon]
MPTTESRAVYDTDQDYDAGEEYTRFIGRKIFFIFSLIILLMLLIAGAATLGPIDYSNTEVYSAILQKFFPDSFNESERTMRVVWDVRLTRILFSILAGMGLGISGAVMQVVLKNPLASPYTLGIASAAGFGAAIAIIAGIGFFGNYLVAGNAFIFALISSFVIIGIAKHKGATPEIMILTGIAIMYLFSALTIFIEYFADPDAVKEVVFWMVGSLARASWDNFWVLFIVLAICIPLLVWKSWDFNVMGAGDETAKSLGVNVDRIRTISMVISSLIVASIVAFTGTIGFIGLVAPHITRMIIGGDNRFVLVGSALLGGLLLASADIVAHYIVPGVIIPIGVMTAFMGVPLFFFLIMRRKREYW